MSALLALSGALLWGAGDFLGGLASRRLAVLTVLAVSQAIGLAGVILWVALAGDPFPGATELLPAAAAGVAGLIGLGALYRRLAVGAMGIVAPISAAGPVVPLAVDAAQGIVPSALQWIGVALVITGIVTISREPASEGGRRVAEGAGLAIVAAISFGAFFVGLDAGADESVPWAVVSARSASVTVALAAAAFTATSLVPPRRLLPTVVGVGVFDTGANVAVGFATTKGHRHRRRPQRSLPRRDRPARPARPPGGARYGSTRRRHSRARRCCARRGSVGASSGEARVTLRRTPRR